MVFVQLFEDISRESSLKISIEPIRLNFDQDTIEFIQDFIANVSQNLRLYEFCKLFYQLFFDYL